MANQHNADDHEHGMPMNIELNNTQSAFAAEIADLRVEDFCQDFTRISLVITVPLIFVIASLAGGDLALIFSSFRRQQPNSKPVHLPTVCFASGNLLNVLIFALLPVLLHLKYDIFVWDCEHHMAVSDSHPHLLLSAPVCGNDPFLHGHLSTILRAWRKCAIPPNPNKRVGDLVPGHQPQFLHPHQPFRLQAHPKFVESHDLLLAYGHPCTHRASLHPFASCEKLQKDEEVQRMDWGRIPSAARQPTVRRFQMDSDDGVHSPALLAAILDKKYFWLSQRSKFSPGGFWFLHLDHCGYFASVKFVIDTPYLNNFIFIDTPYLNSFIVIDTPYLNNYLYW